MIARLLFLEYQSDDAAESLPKLNLRLKILFNGPRIIPFSNFREAVRRPIGR